MRYCMMVSSGYELFGFLAIAVLTIEIAVYAIIVSLASRVTKLSEEEIGKKITAYESELRELSKRVGEGEGPIPLEEIAGIQNRIEKIKKEKSERKELRDCIKIVNAMVKPAIFSIFSIFVLIVTFLFVPDKYALWGFSISFLALAVSVFCEIPVLKTIGKTAIYEEYNPYNEFNKIMADIEKANRSFATAAIKEQAVVSAGLLEKVDVLISEFREKMGLKEPEFGFSFLDSERKEMDVIELEKDVRKELFLFVENKSAIPARDFSVWLTIPTQLEFSTDAAGSFGPRPSCFEDVFDVSFMTKEENVFSPGFKILTVLRFLGTTPGEYELKYGVSTSTHKPKSGSIKTTVK